MDRNPEKIHLRIQKGYATSARDVASHVCIWRNKNKQKAYLPCAGKWIKCMRGGVLVTQHVPRRTGGSPSKSRPTTLEVI